MVLESMPRCILEDYFTIFPNRLCNLGLKK